jgi:hypothetical protein
VVLASGGKVASAGGPQEKGARFDYERASRQLFMLHARIAASSRIEKTAPRQKV